MKTFFFLLALTCVCLAEPLTFNRGIAARNVPLPPPSLQFSIGNLSTNWFTNVVSVLRIVPIDTPCPECGLANHHERKIENVEVFYLVLAQIVAGGQTNQVAIYRSTPMTEIMTNTYVRMPIQPRRQPGWGTLTNIPAITPSIWITNNTRGWP